MLVIRLRRTGRKKQATYSIVVAEKAKAVKGKFLEKVGVYNPTVNPKEFTYDLERIEHWISNGAKPSDTLASLLKKDGVKNMEGFIEPRNKNRKRKKELPEKEEPAPAAEAAPAEEKAEEAPVEEAPKEEPKAEEAAPEAEEKKEEVAEEPKEEPKEETPAEAPAAEEAPAEEAEKTE